MAFHLRRKSMDLSHCKILVVDVTEENIEILVELLSELYDISVVLDGESAMEMIDQEMPDLILLDIMMPGIDGYEVCKKIKSNPETGHIPIIFLTALTHAETQIPAQIPKFRAKFRGHLTVFWSAQ